MQEYMMLKQASDELGLPVSLLRKWCKCNKTKKAFHKFDEGLTAPYYVHLPTLKDLINSGKLDNN